MKIVQIITRMDVVGGAQNHVRDLSIGLKEKGHAITIIAGEKESIHSVIDEEGITYMNSAPLKRALNPLADMKAFLDIRKKLKRIEPDIVAMHSAKAGIIGRLASWSLGIPTIFTAHGWSFTEGIPSKRKRFYKFVEKIVGRITSGIITVSNYDLQLARQHKVATPSKLFTIHNGVHELPALKRGVKEEGKLKIVMVARFEVPKRQLDVIKALQNIQPSKWHVTFAGDGPLLQQAKDDVEEKSLQNAVTFLGKCNHVEEVLAQSDIFILLSDWEGLPLSVLEAMRSSMPVIASDVGGVSEAVEDGVNGFLIKKNDFEQVEWKIKKLLEDPELRLSMGQASREFYESRFTFEKMLHKTNAFYEEIIQSKGKLLSPEEEWLDESLN